MYGFTPEMLRALGGLFVAVFLCLWLWDMHTATKRFTYQVAEADIFRRAVEGS